MGNRLVTPATELPLSLTEVKDHLAEDNADRDGYITGLIRAATGLAQARTLRAIMPQTRETTLDVFPSTGWVGLEYPPVIAVDSVRYLAAPGDWQILSPSSYILDNRADDRTAWLGVAAGRSWPDTHREINAIEIRYRAGYPDAASVPPEIRQWMLLIIGHWYANREAVAPGGTGAGGVFEYVDTLLDIYQVY